MEPRLAPDPCPVARMGSGLVIVYLKDRGLRLRNGRLYREAMKKIADAFDGHYATVSWIVERLEGCVIARPDPIN